MLGSKQVGSPSESSAPDALDTSARPEPGRRPLATSSWPDRESAPLPEPLETAIETGTPEDVARLLRRDPQYGRAADEHARTVRGEAFLMFVNRAYRQLAEDRAQVPGGPTLLEPDLDPATLVCGGGELSVAANAVVGAHPWLYADRFPAMKTAVQTLMAERVGPYRAGPYFFHPHVNGRGELVYYAVFHVERFQNEWIVGPDFVDEFAAMAPFYQGVARAMYPGSRLIEGSTADGAERPPHLPSVVELATRGEAPWQVPETGAAMGVDDTDRDIDLDAGRGAGAMSGLRNSHLRIAHYVEPVQRMAAELSALVNANGIDHMTARREAVDGRNRALRDVRDEMSPGGRVMSRALKSDSGVSVEEMTRRKMEEGLRAYDGKGKRGELLDPEYHARIKAELDADSPAWARHRAGAGALDDAGYRAAMRELGESAWISRAIIQAAGRPNAEMTAIASGGSIVPDGCAHPRALSMLGFGLHTAARGAAAYGIGHMVYNVVSAEEGRRLHVAAQEGVSFMGGLVGAEVGQVFVATVVPWTAARLGLAAVTANPITMVVVSLVGSAVGGAVGGTLAPIGSDEVSRLLLQGSRMAMPVHASAASGGLAGMHDRDQRARSRGDIGNLEHAIFMLDRSIAELEARIQSAPDYDRLQTMQKARLSLIQRREDLSEVLVAARLEDRS